MKLGQLVFNAVDELPWENMGNIASADFVKRVLFLPGALDESGAPVLSKLGMELVEKAGNDPLRLAELAANYSGEQVRKMQATLQAMDLNPLTLNTPTVEGFSSARRMSTGAPPIQDPEVAPYGSLDVPLKMRENNPRSSRQAEPQEGVFVTAASSADESDPFQGSRLFSSTNPFLVGPLTGAGLLGGYYVGNQAMNPDRDESRQENFR
jgi:hypothetical protein